MKIVCMYCGSTLSDDGEADGKTSHGACVEDFTKMLEGPYRLEWRELPRRPPDVATPIEIWLDDSPESFPGWSTRHLTKKGDSE